MLTVKTNNQTRPLIYGYQLTEKEQAEFEWMDLEELKSGAFFRYKGQVYALSEVQRLDCGPLSDMGWHGAYLQTVFSGVLVRLVHGDSEQIIVGRWYE